MQNPGFCGREQGVASLEEHWFRFSLLQDRSSVSQFPSFGKSNATYFCWNKSKVLWKSFIEPRIVSYWRIDSEDGWYVYRISALLAL